MGSTVDFLDPMFLLNVVTVLISFAAVIYWVKLFQKISIRGKQGIGWAWIFASIIMILLMNLSTIVIVANKEMVSIGYAQTSLVNVGALEMVGTIGRTLVAISITIGSYLIYQSLLICGSSKFLFRPVKPVPEEKSQSVRKFDLKVGNSYIIKKNPTQATGLESHTALDMFADLVTHGSLGFIVTRSFPQRIRDRYALLKTPMMWLTREKTGTGIISPVDLAELSHIIREFISSAKDSVVLVDGLEYLIMHNSFEEALELIQGLNDVVVQSGSRLIVTVDPLALTDQQLHLLLTELMVYSG